MNDHQGRCDHKNEQVLLRSLCWVPRWVASRSFKAFTEIDKGGRIMERTDGQVQHKTVFASCSRRYYVLLPARPHR